MDTIAIAVDGMELSLFNKWTEQGYLPNLKELKSNGVYGPAHIKSFSSAEQWTTHFAGVTAETHGVTGFTRDGTYPSDGRRLINLSDIDIKTYPEILDERNRTVGLINPLPIWPPLELENGYCISGMVTPPNAENWVYPPSLEEKLDRLGYQIDVQYSNRPRGFVDDELLQEEGISLSEFKSDFFDILQKRIKTTKYLLEKEKSDYVYLLIKSTDLIQHMFWIHMAANTPDFSDCIQRSYEIVDDFVGWTREEFPNANILVFSDHGFDKKRSKTPIWTRKIYSQVKKHIDVPPRVRDWIYELITDEIKESQEKKVTTLTGDHSNPALWVLDGPDVKSHNTLSISFEDLTPIILTLSDISIPREYPGSVPSEVIKHEPSRDDYNLKIDRRGLQVSSEVTERLHNLGYADMVEKN